MSTEKKYYEYIVVGLGGVGSGALYWLSKRAGKDVLGLEQFKLGHDNGGSQDHSRIIRLMYHDEKYTKLTPHTFDAWAEVERESGLKLVHMTGGLDITRRGNPREQVLEQYAQAMRAQNIPFEYLTPAELKERFPQFTPGEDIITLYQKDGGLVDAALGNATHVQLARGHGADVIENCPVLNVEPTKDGHSLVHTPRGTFKCRRLVVTAGAWINHVLGCVGVHVPVTVTQEQVTYYATPHTKDFTKDKFPIYIFHSDDYDIYGLPIHNNSGSKIGIDVGGPAVTPETRSFTPDPVREKVCTDFLQRLIPKSVGPLLYSKTCLYTMPKDRDFVVDNLSFKGMPQIIVCCGAGHVYKFASLMGKILSEMAIDGKSSYDISAFTINRPAVTDPSFKTQLVINGKSSKL